MKNPFKKIEAKVLDFLFFRLMSNEFRGAKMNELVEEVEKEIQFKVQLANQEQSDRNRVHGFVRYD